MQLVHFKGPERLFGSIANIRITDGLGNSLAGHVEIGDAALSKIEEAKTREESVCERQAR